MRRQVPVAVATISALALFGAQASPSHAAAKKKAATKVTSGQIKLTVDQTLLDVLSRSAIGVSAISPTVASGSFTSTGPLAGANPAATEPTSLTLNVSGGTISAKSKTLKVKTGGGLSLSGQGLPTALELKNPTITIDGAAAFLSADTIVGAQTKLLSLSGVKLPKTATPNQTINVVKSGAATFDDTLVPTLKSFVPLLSGPPLKFGTLSLTVKVK